MSLRAVLVVVAFMLVVGVRRTSRSNNHDDPRDAGDVPRRLVAAGVQGRRPGLRARLRHDLGAGAWCAPASSPTAAGARRARRARASGSSGATRRGSRPCSAASHPGRGALPRRARERARSRRDPDDLRRDAARRSAGRARRRSSTGAPPSCDPATCGRCSRWPPTGRPTATSIRRARRSQHGDRGQPEGARARARRELRDLLLAARRWDEARARSTSRSRARRDQGAAAGRRARAADRSRDPLRARRARRRARGELREAEKEYRAILKLDPTFIPASLALGETLVAAGQRRGGREGVAARLRGDAEPDVLRPARGAPPVARGARGHHPA